MNIVLVCTITSLFHATSLPEWKIFMLTIESEYRPEPDCGEYKPILIEIYLFTHLIMTIF